MTESLPSNTLPPEVSVEVADEWNTLLEQWRRSRASAPTLRDLGLAWQEKEANNTRRAELVAPPSVIEE